MATQPGIYKGIMSRPVATTVADVCVCISTTRCSGQLQAMQRCQKLKTGSFGSMEVAGIKMGKLPEHKATSYMVSKQYRKMKIISFNWYNLQSKPMHTSSPINDIDTKQYGELKIISENPVNLDTQMSQSKPKDTSKSNEIISRINDIDTKQLSELVRALKDDDEDTFLSVVESIRKKHGLPTGDIIQGIQISGDTLIHAAARHKAEHMLHLICQVCPALLTAKNWDGDTVWHVVASEGLDQLLKQLRDVRRKQLVKPETYKGVNSQHFRLNDVNNKGNTALHTAIMSGNESIANDLFEMIPDRESSLYYWQNQEGKSTIYLAAEAGYEKLLRRMMNAVMKHPRNLRKILKGESIIHAAITAKKLVSLNVIMEVAPELFRLTNETGMTPLKWAAEYGSPEVVAYLEAKFGKLQ